MLVYNDLEGDIPGLFWSYCNSPEEAEKTARRLSVKTIGHRTTIEQRVFWLWGRNCSHSNQTLSMWASATILSPLTRRVCASYSGPDEGSGWGPQTLLPRLRSPESNRGNPFLSPDFNLLLEPGNCNVCETDSRWVVFRCWGPAAIRKFPSHPDRRARWNLAAPHR
jgi:hypothetical protein